MSSPQLSSRLKNKKILVTGANGFLGKYLIKQLNGLCREVAVYDGDIKKIHQFHRPYDIVCHLAAITKVTSPDQYKLLLDTNIMGTLSVMNYCQQYKSKCVFASSAAVYQPTVHKKYLSERSPLNPISLYGYSKVVSENICQFYSDNFNIPVTILRIFNMYGPGQKDLFLIPYIMNHLLNNKSIYLKTPKAVRDFIYVTDVVQAFILACAYSNKGLNIFNVGTGKECSIDKVAKLIKKELNAMDKNMIIKRVKNTKKNYVVSNTEKIKNILSWSPQTSLSQGISLMYKDIKRVI